MNLLGIIGEFPQALKLNSILYDRVCENFYLEPDGKSTNIIRLCINSLILFFIFKNLVEPVPRQGKRRPKIWVSITSALYKIHFSFSYQGFANGRSEINIIF